MKRGIDERVTKTLTDGGDADETDRGDATMSADAAAKPRARAANDELTMNDRGEIDELQMDGNEVLMVVNNEAVDETLMDGAEIIDDGSDAKAKPRDTKDETLSMDDNDAVDEVRLLTDGDGINDEVTLLMDGSEIIDGCITKPKAREANDELNDDGGEIIDEVTLLMDGRGIIDDDGGGRRAAR